MPTLKKRLRNAVRDFKDEILYNYYWLRIGTIADPYQILFRSQPYRILFILGHMRSGSSLLTLLLNANPEIIGYGETHINYRSETDFQRLLFKLYRKVRGLRMHHKYALDKVLHNSKILNRDVLLSDRLSSIFLIREPQKSLASIMGIKPKWSEEQALLCYTGRLSRLEDYATSINDRQRCFFATHDQLLNETESVFRKLQQFLDVEQPFSEEYNVLRTTGQRGIGDSSENIKAGKIIRGDRPSKIILSPESVKQGWRAFERCRATLSTYCQTIDRN